MPTSLGRVQPIFKGAYDSATTYKKLDNVFYNGDTWVCQIDNTVNVTPSAESNTWQMVASKGRTGGFGAPSGSIEMLPQGSNPTINITASGLDTEKIFNFQFGIPAGADGTQTYLSSAAPTSSDGYNYFPITALLSPSGIIGNPRQGDLVFYHNSYYQAAGVTDPTLGARCGQAYTLVISAASDQQVQDAVDEYLENHSTITGVFSNGMKNALLTLLEKVAYTVSDGQTYLNALRAELFSANVDSISAVFTQGSAVIYTTDSLDTLKQYLVVTATYDDSSTAIILGTDYTLSGALTEGTSTITVSYGGKTDTFNVSVSRYVPSGYVTDGLVFFLDGKRGFSGNTWIDLIGDKVFTLTNCDWHDNYVIFDGTAYGEYQGAVSSAWSQETIEIVFENSATISAKTLFSQPYIGSSVGSSMRFGAISGGKGNVTQRLDGKEAYHPQVSTLSTNTRHTVSLYNNTAIVDETTITGKAWTNYNKNQTGITYLGANRFTSEDSVSSLFIGKIYAVRIYNRLLTSEEILANQQNDAVYYAN